MTDETVISTATIVWLAFALGGVFGYVARQSNFCTMGAVADIVSMGSWNRMRMWAMAIAVAILGTSLLQQIGIIDLGASIYTGSRLRWLSHLVGGLLFGSGMVLASGCASKALIRLGGGNLKAFVVIVFVGLSAYISLRGLFANWRLQLLDPVVLELEHSQSLPALLGRSATDADSLLLIIAVLASAALLLWVLWRREARTAPVLGGGLLIGLTIVAAWYVSAHLGHVSEHPLTLEEAYLATNSGRPEALSFVAPMAYGLELLMFWNDPGRILSFGIASALGVAAGAGAQAWRSRSFRLESFHDAHDLLRHLGGATLMGFGGVTGLGCSIGQGISGLSTLALGSLITTAAIICGAWMTLKLQYWLLLRKA